MKKIEDLESIYNDLKNLENHRNVDIQHISSVNTSQLQTFFIKKHKTISSNNEEKIRIIKKGLCIIINQMFFVGEKVSNYINININFFLI